MKRNLKDILLFYNPSLQLKTKKLKSYYSFSKSRKEKKKVNKKKKLKNISKKLNNKVKSFIQFLSF